MRLNHVFIAAPSVPRLEIPMMPRCRAALALRRRPSRGRFEIHLPSAANPLAGQIRGAAPEKKRA
jgi:hypothetical protein